MRSTRPFLASTVAVTAAAALVVATAPLATAALADTSQLRSAVTAD